MQREDWRYVARVVLLGTVAGSVACLPVPNRVRDTPTLTGQLLRGGQPLAGTIIAVLPISGLTSAPPSCAAAPLRATTDAQGVFALPSHRHWNPWIFLLGESPEWQASWWLCLVPAAGADSVARILYKGRANAWDDVYLQCDLAREWVVDARHGDEGRCAVLNHDQFTLRRN